VNSILQTLVVLKKADVPLKARQIGLRCQPVRSLNTVIKNIHFLRRGYSEGVILDDDGKLSRDSRENHYWFNRNWTYSSYYHKSICAETSSELDKTVKSENTEIHTPSGEAQMKMSITADSLSFIETTIIMDYFAQDTLAGRININFRAVYTLQPDYQKISMRMASPRNSQKNGIIFWKKKDVSLIYNTLISAGNVGSFGQRCSLSLLKNGKSTL
jgi:hypothetical protein